TQQILVQSQQPTSQPISSQFRSQLAGTSEKIYKENVNRLLLWLYGSTPKFVPIQAPSLPPKPQIKKNIIPNTDDIDEITKGMADISLNMAKMAKNINTSSLPVVGLKNCCSAIKPHCQFVIEN
ncbi:4399_t:CDS:2, partial [Dentiscutata erythropus]